MKEGEMGRACSTDGRDVK